MKSKLITDVTTEPITLAEVKSHLRLDSSTFASDISTTQLLEPMSRTAATYTSSGVSVAGYRALINLNSGINAATGTVAAHIEESDDNITYTDWSSGTFTTVTTANDQAVQEKEYTGTKQYIRVVAVVANAACVFGIDLILDSDDTTEDSQLTAWITAARQWGEAYTSHMFAPKTYDFYLDEFPNGNYIELPEPLTTVTSVKYKNSAGTETTMTLTTEYIVDVDSQPGGIYLPYGVSWASFVAYPINPITIRATVGYTGVVPYIIPKCFKQAMLVHIGLFYKYRDEAIPDADLKTVKALYGQYTRKWF